MNVRTIILRNIIWNSTLCSENKKVVILFLNESHNVNIIFLLRMCIPFFLSFLSLMKLHASFS